MDFKTFKGLVLTEFKLENKIKYEKIKVVYVVSDELTLRIEGLPMYFVYDEKFGITILVGSCDDVRYYTKGEEGYEALRLAIQFFNA
jgi:hypothetical protein